MVPAGLLGLGFGLCLPGGLGLGLGLGFGDGTESAYKHLLRANDFVYLKPDLLRDLAEYVKTLRPLRGTKNFGP